MKLSCTVEQALEDVIVVSLKYKTKEFRGILLDSSQRHLPPGLCFHQDSQKSGDGEVTSGENSVNSHDHDVGVDYRGATLVRRYSYNNDPAKYNEQPLPTTQIISIRSSRSKTVRNIRLRPRQTLCSKCKNMIHDSKPKSPHKNLKPEGENQGEMIYHNTRFRAANANKNQETNASAGPALRSGLRNRRNSVESPKVLLENIRPKREVRSTAKRKTSPESSQKLKLVDSSAKRSDHRDQAERSQSQRHSNKDVDIYGKAAESMSVLKQDSEFGLRVVVERSAGIDGSSSTLSQYNKQPVIKLEKSLVQNLSAEERTERPPTLQIVNIPKPSPAIKISYGDGAVLKIPPRLPGTEMKSPEDHSTAEESPMHNPEPPLPLKKIKKASKRSRDKQRYRSLEDNISSDPPVPGIKISVHHRKHKRKHKHRHANNGDENYNLEASACKFPTIITKYSLVSDNVGESDKGMDFRKSDISVKQSMNIEDDFVDDISKAEDEQTTISADQIIFDKDPLRLDDMSSPPSICGVSDHSETNSFEHTKDKVGKAKASFNDAYSSKVDTKTIQIWSSPGKADGLSFESEGSPAKIEAPPFQTDDSPDEIEIKPLKLGSSPEKVEGSLSAEKESWGKADDENSSVESEDEAKKVSLPYGHGVFEDLTPDEDEGSHDDLDASQPAYHLPVTKNARLVYTWHQGGALAQAEPSHVSGISAYFPNSPAPLISSGSASLYQNSSHVYQNGPSSVFPNSPGSSIFSNNPAPAFSSSSGSVFQTSSAPRIQNSPTPIIQKSPVPIFQYNISRHQGSPNRRYQNSPQRRYHSVSENSGNPRYQAVVDGAGGSVQRSTTQPSIVSRYHGDGSAIRYLASAGDTATGSGSFVPQSDSSALSAIKYQSKVDGRSAVRFQPQADNSISGFQVHATDATVSTLLRAQASADNSSTAVLYPSSVDDSVQSSVAQHSQSLGDKSNVPRFIVQNENDPTATRFKVQGSSSLLSGFTIQQSEGSTTVHYQTPGSSVSRYPVHSDGSLLSNYQMVKSPAAGLKVQHDNSPSSVTYEKEKKRTSVSVPSFSKSVGANVTASNVFITHGSPATHVQSSSVPRIQGKLPLVLQLPFAGAASVDPLSGSGSVPSHHDSAVMFQSRDHRHVSIQQGQSSSTVFQGQSSAVLPQGHTLPTLSQGKSQYSSNISNSENDSDSDSVVDYLPNSKSSSHQVTHSDQDHGHSLKIQAQSVTKCCNSEGREFHIGDIVWGKDQTLSWWPCRILSIVATQNDHDKHLTHVVHVSFLGNIKRTDIKSTNLRPFREEFRLRFNKRKQGQYIVAVKEALVATQSLNSQDLDFKDIDLVSTFM
ncbi:hypothetical protein C0Q70_08870 [Pomacea canaliculata]|uniref:PWWP domain-containing protein n=2 Tax=Pomacea canaliculata TaxID=400727 RepID=A0A2T7P860_POMCA|nr:hypothetical protein C0Q70_08870 [Pomacea canaliculata]